MAKSGRLVWIKSVLAAILIYTIIADGLPPWARKEIDTICRRFLWARKEGFIHGKCMVAWPIVCRPKELGGLEIPDLHLTDIALQALWLWLKHIDEHRAWSELAISVNSEVQAFFTASTYTIVKNGNNTNFWTGWWLKGQSIKDLAPALMCFVSCRHVKQTIVVEALLNRHWVTQIMRGLSIPAIQEYLRIWDMLQLVQLNDSEDRLVWRWTADMIYTSWSAYRALHSASHPIPGCDRLCRQTVGHLGAATSQNLPLACTKKEALDGRQATTTRPRRPETLLSM